ncbi:MAG: DNA polymerase III subunit epsilon [Eggerthellaceae bacterium]|nr:DNA polymerase III subunit epsilon [Eggerthellaceae bacterium]
MSKELNLEDFVLGGTPVEVLRLYQELPQIAAENLFGELDENIVIVDTEATGLSFRNDELIQIAACRLDKGEITDWFDTFVDPSKPLKDEIVHLTGIDDSDLEGAPSPQEALAELVEFVGDSMLVAHNARFDSVFCTKHPQGYPLLENIWLDSLDLARVALPRFKGHRLIELSQAFRTTLSTHRANDDVRSTFEVYRILLAGISQLPSILLKELAELAEPQDWNTVVAFRKMLEWKESLIREDEKCQIDCAGHRALLRGLRAERLKFYEDEFELGIKTTVTEMDEEGQNPSFPSDLEIEEAFSGDGFAFVPMEETELRNKQLIMAKAVNSAFAKSESLVVEASTGVGKSLAYLVPAALSAKRNNISVGVSTKSNKLLDQLVYKDIPYLRKCFQEAGQDLSYSEFKGFSNYLCLYKFELFLSVGAKFCQLSNGQVHQAPSFAAILAFVCHTAYDNIEHIKINRGAVPVASITVSSHKCLKCNCPYYGKNCFALGAYEHARNVDIVLTNHSLLFSNAATEGKLLSKIEYWVVDEAHSAVSEARSATATKVSAENMISLGGQLCSGNVQRNPYMKAQLLLGKKQPSSAGCVVQCCSLAAQYGKLLDDLARRFKDLLEVPLEGNRSYEFYELWLSKKVREGELFQGLARLAEECINAGERFLASASLVADLLDVFKEARDIQREISFLSLVFMDLQDSLRLIFGPAQDKYVYSAKMYKAKDRHHEVLSCQLLNVGDELNQQFYPELNSCVYTSATLAVGDSFSFFEDSVGLNKDEFSHCSTLQLKPCFDMYNNMVFYIATDMPGPFAPDNMLRLRELLTGVHLALGGFTLSLFTNRRKMEQAFEQVRERLKQASMKCAVSAEGKVKTVAEASVQTSAKHKLRVVCQKWGTSNKMLYDDFLEDKSLSLFALKSFWEGFEAPGETLRCVVITQLPFLPKNNPLSRECAARKNYSWFKHDLAESVLSVKQAVEGIICSKKDRGCVVFADSRLIEKNYGEQYLAGLPASKVKKMSCAEIVADIKSQDF